MLRFITNLRRARRPGRLGGPAGRAEYGKVMAELLARPPRLRPLNQVSLWGLNRSATVLQRSRFDTAHGFADHVAAVRQGIASLQADTAPAGGRRRVCIRQRPRL